MEIFQHFPVLVPVLALLIAEVLKLAIDFGVHHHLERRDFLQSGGMPSGHSTAVSALAVTAFWKFGVESVEFAITIVFAMIVLYDALKLRQAAGRHAAKINSIIGEKRFNERLGHTPIQVLAGVILGSGIAFLFLF